MDTIRTCTALNLQHAECVVEATEQILAGASEYIGQVTEVAKVREYLVDTSIL